jgi:hypothetical protein
MVLLELLLGEVVIMIMIRGDDKIRKVRRSELSPLVVLVVIGGYSVEGITSGQ